jgi:hypothetical protein
VSSGTSLRRTPFTSRSVDDSQRSPEASSLFNSAVVVVADELEARSQNARAQTLTAADYVPVPQQHSSYEIINIVRDISRRSQSGVDERERALT